MPLQNTANLPQNPPKETSLFLAMAGHFDKQSRILAKNLDAGREVYIAYAFVDSLCSSYSMFRYVFDMFFADPDDPERMHNLMLTPMAIAAITAEAVFLIGFSVLAACFENEKDKEEKDRNPYKVNISAAWPYFRDLTKGLKNSFKGWRSAILALDILTEQDFSYLIMPVGLLLGAAAVANRLWMRSMLEARKTMMSTNSKFLLETKKQTSVYLKEIEKFIRDDIKYQTNETRNLAYLAVSIGGLIDGLYLYVGVLGLAALSPSTFIIMAIISAIYTVTCIIVRLYEEYDFQQRLIITQTNCRLALYAIALNSSYAELLVYRNLSEQTQYVTNKTSAIENELRILIDLFETNRLLLASQTSRTYFNATLLGIKNGLYAYSALTSIVFLASAIMALTGTAFPSFLLVACVSLGLTMMCGFVAHSLYSNYLYLHKEPTPEELPYAQIGDIKRALNNKTADCAALPEMRTFKQSVKAGLVPNPAPQFFFQEWFEVVRSFFSGIGKGQKFVDFAGNFLQEADEHGHYHDTPLMYIFSTCNALLFAVVLGLRALARGLGRTPLGQVDLTENITIEEETMPAPVNTERLIPASAPIYYTNKDLTPKPPKTWPRYTASTLSLRQSKHTPAFHKPAAPTITSDRLLPHSKSSVSFDEFDSIQLRI